ncbi:unnamed protein product, partial [Mesorhabditis belari]|uniref:Protein kinase domain-containing protein n=1 Tax=Mesorhabditis belari TaxID=2138241 RepID=A0AAF3FK73_9BILA
MHDHIATMKDSFWSFSEKGTLNHVWIATERMDFKLSDFFRGQAKKDDTPTPAPRDHRHLASMLVQILQALAYLHQRGIMHRDVKSDNIGLSKPFNLKLFDFGVARILDVFGVPGNKYQEFFKNKLINEKPRDGTFNAFLTTACTRLGPPLRDMNGENFQDLLGKMLCINPRRTLARELLEQKYLKAMNAELLKNQGHNTLDDHKRMQNERDKETLIKTLKNFSTQL